MRQGYAHPGDGRVRVTGMTIKLNISEAVHANDFMLSRENC